MKKQKIPWVDKYRPVKLDDVKDQEEVVKVLKNIVQTGNMPHLLLYGPAGTGKCLGKDTPVIMYSGAIKKVQDITVDDILMGDNGEERYVLNTVMGVDKMFKIIQTYGDDYVVNSEHIISLKLEIPYVINTNFDRKGCDIIYFADGIMKTNFVSDIHCFDFMNEKLDKKGDIVNISIGAYVNMPDIWKKCFKGFKCNALNPKDWTYDDSGSAFIHGYNISSDSSLSYDLGLTNKYKTSNLKTRQEFIRGLLKKTGSPWIKILYKPLFDNIVFIIRSLGILTSCYSGDTYYCKAHIEEELTYDIFVEELQENIYFGFEITGNRRFLLGDFTVTHNTTSILAIANELFGPNKIDERVIELNASDERGINIVRNKIVTLAKTSVSERDMNYVCPPFKIIILDEADAMTVEAQSALRKIMEDNSAITRFCFVCNFINQIIGPIASRCAKFRFKSIDLGPMKSRLMYIGQREGLKITEEGINLIHSTSNGDMRKAITLLQNLSYLKKDITIDDICGMACIVPKQILTDIMTVCTMEGDVAIKIANLTSKLIMDGYPLTNLLESLVLSIINDKDLTDKMKSVICLHIANTEHRLLCGADEYMQLLSIFMCIKNISNGLNSVYDMISL